MWSITPQSWFSPRYGVEEDGRPIGTLELGKWRECGAIVLETRRLTIRREGFWCPRYHLQDGERTLASAHPASWRGGFRIAHEGAEYLVDRSSFFGRSYALLRGSRRLGEVRAVGFCSRRVEAEVGSEVARELGLFAVWLVLLEWRRGAAAAGGAGVAAIAASSS